MSDEGKPKRKVSRLRYATSIIVLVVCLLIYLSFATQWIASYEVISNSMAPTLQKGDRVLVLQGCGFKVRVGDVVALEDPQFPGTFLMTKRVAAMAGQTVELDQHYLLVDGVEWAPPGIGPRAIPDDRAFTRTTLRDGQVFVLGDNTETSEDSLDFGPVPIESIRGKVIFIYWPWRRMGRVR